MHELAGHERTQNSELNHLVKDPVFLLGIIPTYRLTEEFRASLSILSEIIIERDEDEIEE